MAHLAAIKSAAGEKLRAEQVGQLFDALAARRLRRARGRGRAAARDVAADLNASPAPAAGRGGVAFASEAYPAALAHALGVRSAYGRREGAWTTWKRRGELEMRHEIDYVLVGEGVEPTRVLLAPADEHVGPGRLPAWRYRPTTSC